MGEAHVPAFSELFAAGDLDGQSPDGPVHIDIRWDGREAIGTSQEAVPVDRVRSARVAAGVR